MIMSCLFSVPVIGPFATYVVETSWHFLGTRSLDLSLHRVVAEKQARCPLSFVALKVRTTNQIGFCNCSTGYGKNALFLSHQDVRYKCSAMLRSTTESLMVSILCMQRPTVTSPSTEGGMSASSTTTSSSPRMTRLANTFEFDHSSRCFCHSSFQQPQPTTTVDGMCRTGDFIAGTHILHTSYWRYWQLHTQFQFHHQRYVVHVTTRDDQHNRSSIRAVCTTVAPHYLSLSSILFSFTPPGVS